MTSRFSLAYESQSKPISVSILPRAYLLVAFAILMTLIGVFAGGTFAASIVASGWLFLLFILEIVLIVSAPAWSRQFPLNIALFAAFPFLSGLTITPFLLSVLASYVNGATILLNATISTMLLTLAAAVFVRSTTMNLGATIGRFLLQSLMGLIIFGLLQLFIPSLRGSAFEVVLSGFGIVTFSLFLAWDMQRIAQSGRTGDSPFLLALSLYLDIFNLFLYVSRFMLAMSGERR